MELLSDPQRMLAFPLCTRFADGMKPVIDEPATLAVTRGGHAATAIMLHHHDMWNITPEDVDRAKEELFAKRLRERARELELTDAATPSTHQP
jgi:hypothetical protein